MWEESPPPLEENDNPTAVGYARTSPSTNDEGTSLPNQKRDIREYCEENDIELIDIYEDEDVSGRKTDPIAERDGFGELESVIMRKDVDYILVRNGHRVSRNLEDMVGIRKRLGDRYQVRHGIYREFPIYDIKGEEYNYHNDPESELSPIDQMMETMTDFMKQLVAGMKAAQISEDTTNALERKKERGHPVGRPPYGLATDKKIYENQDEATEYLPGPKFRNVVSILNTFAEACEDPTQDGGDLSAYSVGKDYGVSSPSKTVKRIWEKRDLYREVAQHANKLGGEVPNEFEDMEVSDGIDWDVNWSEFTVVVMW